MSQLPKARFLDPTTPPTLFTLVIIAAIGATSLNIFLPSLPAIADEFGTSYNSVQFLVTGYLLTTGVLQLVVGPISDRYGRRPIQIFSLIIFILASVACVYAPNITLLLCARMIQAVVVASFVLSRAAVRDIVPANQAASMMGYLAMGMSVAPMLAPTVGGFLQEYYGWTSPFWALAVAGTMVLALVWRDMGETNLNRSPDMLTQVKLYPILLKSRRFWGYALAASFASACFFAMLGGAPFVGEQVYNLTPSQLGIYFIFTPLGYFAGNFISSQLSTRFGIYRMIIIGACLPIAGMTISLILISSGATHALAFFGLTISIGLGNGMVLPNASAGMLNIDPKLAGTAAGLGGSLMTLGGAAFSAIVISLLTPESGATPLILCIILSGFLCLLAGLYSNRVEYQVRKTQA